MTRESPGSEIANCSPDQEWITGLSVDLSYRVTVRCDLQLHGPLDASIDCKSRILDILMVGDIGPCYRSLLHTRGRSRTRVRKCLDGALGCPCALAAPVVEKNAFNLVTGYPSNHGKLQSLAILVV